MEPVVLIIYIFIGTAFANIIALGLFCHRLKYKLDRIEDDLKSAADLISEETKRKQAHTQAFERMTDPNAIQAEMERGADILEARQANRLTLPREDAGPPARVWRGNMRPKIPSTWVPPKA